MQREKLIGEIQDAIQAKIDELAEASSEFWDCYLPDNTALLMARNAVAIVEAFEASEKFVERNAG
jgi:hypothetical protein